MKVIVIGGGLAGIAAASVLVQSNASVTLLEAKRRLGGRAGSFAVSRDAGMEEAVDYCQHVGMGCCHNLKRLIAWLGHEEQWQEHRVLHMYGPTGRYQRLAALPLLPAPLHLTNWLLRWPGLSLRDRLCVARGLLRIRRLVIDDSLDHQSAFAWLEETGQTQRAIANFWSTIIVSALGEEVQRVSLAAVCKVLQDGFLNDRQAFHLLVPRRPLSQLFHEDASNQLCRQGVDLRLASPVTRILRQGNEFEVQCGQHSLRGDTVVLAVPWHQMSRVEVECEMGKVDLARAGTGLQSSPITGIHTWWDRDWLDTPHATIVGRCCQWVFPKSVAFRNSVHPKELQQEHYYQIVISASRELPQASRNDFSAWIHDDLDAVFPRLRKAQLLRHKVVTDPQAVFSVTPGALQWRPTASTSIPGLWLAGDWTNTGWPSTMESAILSGFRAAEGILGRSTASTRMK